MGLCTPSLCVLWSRIENMLLTPGVGLGHCFWVGFVGWASMGIYRWYRHGHFPGGVSLPLEYPRPRGLS